ncbi:MAG: tRNA (adenosine(37)-N6)-threonylcarbamoyltransferase complex ATPase subunit type 1 TsaE [Cytophagales bacterium]|nr:tRNA (adenosine(37)-N6)-threonylcarbamoyltransferase complex ATPase subunit type 1 TsaE [Cytophagales bacterium]
MDKKKEVLELTSRGAEELTSIARQIIEFAGEETIWRIEGEMGAGKTTLVIALCQALGILDHATSPTFSLVNEYQDEQGTPYYHFDFYRIKEEEEAAAIGTEEYFDSGAICFLEWASLIPNLLPEQYLLIQIDILDPMTRRFKVTKHHE